MKHIKEHIWPYKWFLLTSIVFIALQAYCNLLMPNIMSNIVNVGIQEYSQKIAVASGEAAILLKAEQQRYIIKTGFKMLSVALFTGAFTLMAQYCNARFGTSLARDLRKNIFSKIESFSNAEFDKFSTASLITRTTNDVQQVQMMFTMGIRMLIFAPFMGIGGTIMAMKKAPSMAWINALSVLLVLCIISIVYKFVIPKFKIIQKLVDKLNLVARESLSGLMVVRAFSTQKYEEERFKNANDDYKKVNLYVNRVMSLMGPTMAFVQNIVPVIIVLVGAGKIAQSQLLIGDMMAYIQYSGNIMGAFMMISSMFVMIPRAKVSINRISEVLDTENVIIDKENPIELKDEKCEVTFDSVTFKYPNSDGEVLKDISFTAKPGQTIAIIGSTGCGKTSLVNLIPRFYDVTSGSVKINGIDVRDISIKSLRNAIGYTPQKSILISGTIRSNIMGANPNATEEDMIKSCEIAQATEFIENKEEKYDYPISQGGTNVSGGQRQRISIARAVIRKAPIYIFDDSFSALDFSTDLKVRKALKENLSDSTIIIVGQRVASIMDSDSIIVMDEGKIVGKGTHDELMKSCKEYREIAYSQLSEEEV